MALGAGSADLGDGGDVEGLVELAVAAAVQSVAHDASAAGFDGSGSVGHGEAGFGPVTAGVTGLCDDLCGCEGADAVDIGEAGAALGDLGGDPRAELVDVAVQAPDVGDAVSGDLGSCGGVAAQQPRGGVEPLGAAARAGAGVVSAADLLQGAVEAVDGRGAVFDQLAAVVDQALQVIGASAQRGAGKSSSLAVMRAISSASMWSVLAPVRRPRRAAAVI